MELTYHQLPGDEILKNLDANSDGLSTDEVRKRQEKYGRNTMPQPKSKTLFQIFFHQFLNPLIYVLIGAAVISVITGDYKDAIFITAIIVINAILGTYQEGRLKTARWHCATWLK